MKAKAIHFSFVCLLLPCIALAQGSAQQTGSSKNDTDLATEVKALRDALLQTQKQMAAQQREIEALKERAKTEQAASVGGQQPPSMIDAAIHTPIPSSPGFASSPIGANVSSQPVSQEQAKENQRPLGSFNIGDAVFTPGGF